MNGVEILLIVGAGIAVYAIAGRRGLQPGLVVVILAALVSFIPAPFTCASGWAIRSWRSPWCCSCRSSPTWWPRN